MRNTIFVLLIVILGINNYHLYQDIIKVKRDLRTLTRIYGDVIAREVMIYDEVAKLGRMLQKATVIEKKQDGRKKK